MVDVWMHMDGWMDGRLLMHLGGWMDGRCLFQSEFPSPHLVWSIGDTHLPCMTSAHIHMDTGSALLIVAGILNIDLGIGQAML